MSTRKNMFRNKDGELLCESPDFGLICDNIGINGKKGSYVCMKYPDQELLEDRDGWVRRCKGCIEGNAHRHQDVFMYVSTIFGAGIEAAIKQLKHKKATKSRVLATAIRPYWAGYVNSGYINCDRMFRKAFDQLVDLGFIKYVPRKPCVWVEEPTKRS
ncbi:MAG: hypothetical protein OEM02_17005 [Desulfobulbaceae bacterium]|nr:hypothetical protein [Desulfobulbaceae bacterium]